MLTFPTIKPDVIVSWPRNCDYPLWRHFIRTNRDKFGHVLVVFTETNSGDDYKPFVQQAMETDAVTFLLAPKPQGEQDWRDLAVNHALTYSNSDWVWFTEQDFVITEPNTFWYHVYERSKNFDVVAIAQQTRIHPASIFMRRTALERTRRDFGIDPGRGDHFCKIQDDIQTLKISKCLFIDGQNGGYKHYNGLSHNWYLASTGQSPNYKVEEFTEWLEQCLNLPHDILIANRFIEVANSVITAYPR